MKKSLPGSNCTADQKWERYVQNVADYSDFKSCFVSSTLMSLMLHLRSHIKQLIQLLLESVHVY